VEFTASLNWLVYAEGAASLREIFFVLIFRSNFSDGLIDQSVNQWFILFAE